MIFVGLAFVAIVTVIWWRKKPDSIYWAYCFGAYVWLNLVTVLCSGGGTLENPAGDGIFTHLIRKAVDDGPFMALWGLGVMIAAYGGAIYLVKRGLKLGLQTKQET